MLGTDCVVSFPRHPYKSPDQRDEAIGTTRTHLFVLFLKLITDRVYQSSALLSVFILSLRVILCIGGTLNDQIGLKLRKPQ